MSQVLYRKYRSKNFKELIGQEKIKEILIQSVSKDSISHAYLFSGPRGTGKTSTARIMAKAINCLKFPDGSDVCNDCENCNLIDSGSSTDIIEMDAASNRGIEEIRALKESVGYMPSSLKYKVYIIDEVHMLTKEAFNALLKTLEEPPSHVIFIMATTEPHKLPVTILSRVQRYDFSLGNEDEVTNKLKSILDGEEITYDSDSLKMLYKYSGGSFRDAESLLSKVINNLEAKEIEINSLSKSLGLISTDLIDNLLNDLLENNAIKAIEDLNIIERESSDLATFINQFIFHLRDRIVAEIAEGKSPDIKLVSIIEEFIKVRGELRNFDDKKILIQMAIVRLTSTEEKNIKVTKVVKETKKEEPKREELRIKNEELKPEIKGDVELMSKLVNASKEFNARLKAILLSSSAEINDKTLNIHTGFKFNASYLEKPEVKEFLIKTLGNINNVKIIMASSKESTIEPEVKVIEEQKDNSDLVEDIL